MKMWGYIFFNSRAKTKVKTTYNNVKTTYNKIKIEAELEEILIFVHAWDFSSFDYMTSSSMSKKIQSNWKRYMWT